jgi:signal transduction histidine kinase/DNA-binding response OmpR family regulator
MGENKLDSTAWFFSAGLKKSRAVNDRFLTATGLYHESRYYESMHNLPQALDRLHEAYAIFKELDLKKNISNCFNSYNRIYQSLGDFTKALTYGLQALRIKEEINDRRGIAIALTNVGNIYLRTSRYDEAIDNFTKALAIDRSNKDEEGITMSLLNVGVACQKKGLYAQAIQQYREALELARRLKMQEDEKIILGNIGSTLRRQGKFDSSLIYLQASLAIGKEGNYRITHTLNDISETYLALKQAAPAKDYAQQAIAVAQKTGDLDQLRFGWMHLSDASEMLGDFESAHRALKQYNIFKDSVFTLDKVKQMDGLRLQYETEKKDQAIDLLTRQKEAALFRRNTWIAIAALTAVILLLLYNRQRLKNKKDRQVYEKGLEIEKMKSDFFSNISHEFRTPLTLILGPVQSMQAGITDPILSSQLHMMEKNARRLQALIDQLLDLSKLDSGKLTITFSKLDIVSLMKGVTMTFSSMADIKEIALTAESPVDNLQLYADREKIETILINLLSNAFKFTPQKGSIKVSLYLKEKEHKEYCCISVHDSGTGIPAKDIPHVFERFYQSNYQQGQQVAGTGIGLALAKELVSLHNGHIEIFSEPGQGTNVLFWLPLGSAHLSEEELLTANHLAVENIGAAKPAIYTQPIAEEGGEEIVPGKPVLLLIEDNRDVMTYLRQILDNHYQVVEAADGIEGITAAIETIPDLVISDVMMPRKNGYEVCEALKNDERTSHIPLILLTARASFENKMQGLQTKADEYLTKPFSPQELLVRVQNLVTSRRELREKFNRELVLKPSGVRVTSIEEAFLQKLMKSVEDNLADERFSIEQLARQVGMSRSQLHRKLHALTNESATQFINRYRLTRAMDMIRQNAGSMAEIAYWVGFSSPSYFSKLFHQQFGITPGQARTNQG